MSIHDYYSLLLKEKILTGTRAPSAANLAEIQKDISNIRTSNALLQELLANSLSSAALKVSVTMQA